MCSPARASSTVRRRRSWRRCSTKAITCARSGRCIGSWPPISRSESGAISASIPSTPSPSWWPRRRTRPGPGTSPSCWGPTKWTYFYLYVVLDIFSRYAVGWMVADRENSALAGRLIEETCHKQGVQPQVLTLHSDRGAPMTSKCTAQLLADLGVTRSLSRPQVSDDNPLLRGPVQDPEVPPRLPWPLPRHHRRDRLLPNVLPLVQHRTSPWRDRDAHPGRRPSQSNPERAGAARADPSSRLDPSSRTLRSRDPTTGSPSPSRLDQPTCDTHNRRNCSVNRNRHCLKVVDRFRKRMPCSALPSGSSLRVSSRPRTASARMCQRAPVRQVRYSPASATPA